MPSPPRPSRELRTAGHQVVFHNLYQEQFDPILRNTEIPKGAAGSGRRAALPPGRRSQRLRRRASELVGDAAGDPQGLARPRVAAGRGLRVFRRRGCLCKGKSALVLTTSNTPPARTSCGCSATPWRTFGRPASSDFCGVEKVGPAATSSPSCSARPTSAALARRGPPDARGVISRRRVSTRKRMGWGPDTLWVPWNSQSPQACRAQAPLALWWRVLLYSWIVPRADAVTPAEPGQGRTPNIVGLDNRTECCVGSKKAGRAGANSAEETPHAVQNSAPQGLMAPRGPK